MEMEEAAAAAACYRAHVVVLPFHGQGHMNPMIQFSKRLASQGIKITLACTLSATKTMPPQAASISFESIYDDLNQNEAYGASPIKVFLDRFQSVGSENLIALINKHQGSNNPIKCLVYDANLPWALDVAKGLGILGAAFFTQSCATIASYHQMFADNSTGSEQTDELGLAKLPSMGSMSILEFIVAQLVDIDKADWVLFNSFDKLEDKEVKDLLKVCKVRTIGPTVPSMYLDERVQGDKDYGFNQFQSSGDTCINWLNTKETGSVVYVSFGSAASLSAEQMEELALGLKHSNASFLWVVRKSEENKLPVTFKEETSKKGLVVTWCPQLEVLAHKSVGCFMSHCGWNSTMEAVSLGVPLIAMPQFLDQFSDARFVEEVWEVGVRPKVDEKGLVTWKEIKECIKEVMQGERGEKIKRNACKWRELAKVAVDEGGSSDRNIMEIIGHVTC